MDCLVTQVYFGQVVHVVTEFGLYQVMGNHGVKERTLHLNSVVAQNHDVIFYVLSDLESCRIFKDGAENLKHPLLSLLLFGHGHIPGLMFL